MKRGSRRPSVSERAIAKRTTSGSLGSAGEAHAALHVDEQRIEIEVLDLRPTRQPALPPGRERRDHGRELGAGGGEGVFRPVLARDARHRADVDQLLQPLGQHSARDPRDAAANVVEAPAAAQQLAHHEQGPPPAEHLVGARHRAELAVAGHWPSVARRDRGRGTDSGPGGARSHRMAARCDPSRDVLFAALHCCIPLPVGEGQIALLHLQQRDFLISHRERDAAEGYVHRSGCG
jgi:hypothetical protein